MLNISRLLGLLVILVSCNTGKLEVIADLPMSLEEISAVETISGSDLLWVIEDAGNKNNLYGLDKKGKIIKDIDISNSSNIDWEDLTSDSSGNLYIGDFGNNSKNRDAFTIYKISDLNTKTNEAQAERINFLLPKEMKPEDFEAFFLFNDYFYVFSKENKSGMLIKVPNKIGKHTAELVTEFNLDGKHDAITSADISNDGKTVVLLNHEKVWKLSNFKGDNFFSGKVEKQDFKHKSQKEGICFQSKNEVLITDERNKHDGNLYSYIVD